MTGTSSTNDLIANAWLTKIYAVGTSESSDLTGNLLEYFMECAKDGELAVIDILLGKVEPALISKLCMITLLRGTFRFKHHLSNWATLRDKVAAELLVLGEDPKKLLRGLFGTEGRNPSGALDNLLQVHPSLRN